MTLNLEIADSDNLTTIAPSFELNYRFRTERRIWSPYLGGGVRPIFYSVDCGGSDTQFSLYIQDGIMKNIC